MGFVFQFTRLALHHSLPSLAHLDLRADALRDGGEPLVGAVRQLLTPGPLALAEGRTVSQEVSAENMTVLRKSDHPGSRT